VKQLPKLSILTNSQYLDAILIARLTQLYLANLKFFLILSLPEVLLDGEAMKQQE
jgi:hypothetical protein